MKKQYNNESFKPAWWLKNKHLQTLWPFFTFKKNKLTNKKQRLELNDGDFIDIHWFQSNKTNKNSPIVILLHGTGGNVNAHYFHTIIPKLIKKNWKVAAITFRGCGAPNRNITNYHAGDTQDIDLFINYIKKNKPSVDIFIIGYSLGGNNLLKWLGQIQNQNLITAAIAISPPFLLKHAINNLDTGFSKLYQWWLLRHVKYLHIEKNKFISYPIDDNTIRSLKNFREYTYKIVAPVQGYTNLNEYYKNSSCYYYLQEIQTPTLIIKSKDDPFVGFENDINYINNNPSITLEITEKGGHLGYISGNIPLWGTYWVDNKVIHFINSKTN